MSVKVPSPGREKSAPGTGLRALRLWHAQCVRYNTAKAEEYRAAAANSPGRWGRLISNAEGFEATAAFHARAVATLNEMFAAPDVVENDPALASWHETFKPKRGVKPGSIKLFTFEFKGLALGGSAIVAAGDEETAAGLVSTPRGDKAVLADTREFTVPSLIHYDNGDY